MIITAPEELPDTFNGFSECIFLGGSIEQGTAVNWQEELAVKCEKMGYTVLRLKNVIKTF